MTRTIAVLVATLALAAPAAGGSHGFSARVTNPWFPLKPGTVYTYQGVKDGKPSREVLRVTHRTKTIQGVPCVVVDDRLYVEGHLAERTNDWYSQDARGTVWYFGEATAELDKSGKVTSTEGTWQSGRDGAKAGIYMPAHPRAGQTGRQEYYRGKAEDRGDDEHRVQRVGEDTDQGSVLRRRKVPDRGRVRRATDRHTGQLRGEIRVQLVREDGAEERDADRAAHLAEEQRAGGGHAHEPVVDGVLNSQHQHLHRHPEP